MDLLNSANKNGREYLGEFALKNSGLVWSIVRRFAGRGYEADDLYQLGMIGLIKAVRRFDSSYNVKFSTYAVPLIVGEIKRFLRDDGIIKVSRHYKEIALKASKVSAELEEEYMRSPQTSEIAEKMGIDVYTLTEALCACVPCDSIYRSVSEDGKGEILLVDVLCGDDEDAICDRTALRIALTSLGERERKIVICRYFFGETQMQVAHKLGISQVQVSRLEKKALSQLKEKLKDCC